MKILMLTALLSLSGLLFCNPTPKHQKLINYLKDINESLIQVVNLPMDTYRQKAHLERAKTLVQEAIVVEQINDNATLYSIAGILLNDPLYAARAVELQKSNHPTRSNTVQLVRREEEAEDQAETYRQTLEDMIQEEEGILLFDEFLNDADKQSHQNRLKNLKKTKDWAEAQCLVHGMLKNALYMYQNNKDQGGSSGSKLS